MKLPQQASFGTKTCSYGKQTWLSFGEGCVKGNFLRIVLVFLRIQVRSLYRYKVLYQRNVFESSPQNHA